ncbi:hypothetical protein LSH36_37g06026 [Paralvinella palmiformis]|uniref:Uncharacterized protein n=1 Tax=Paralvinella palmiformis TaxID=53620 RepID=A0AAD9K8G7_9ANNE|nr:hypothetical protein LSH36_37g06026 [Paralvinella palmiformis]
MVRVKGWQYEFMWQGCLDGNHGVGVLVSEGFVDKVIEVKSKKKHNFLRTRESCSMSASRFTVTKPETLPIGDNTENGTTTKDYGTAAGSGDVTVAVVGVTNKPDNGKDML